MLQPKHKGFLLALEGPDGSGKSTLREWFAEWFTTQGIVPVLTREPGGTHEAEIVRERILLNRGTFNEAIRPLSKTMMFMTARALHLENLIWPRLAQGDLIITDRFCDSTFAYQSEEGMDMGKLEAMHGLIFDDFQADLTIVLDGDPAIFRQRMVTRAGGESNYYDRKPESFHVNTRAVYRSRAEKYPERYALIDATQNIEQVQAQIIPYLMQVDGHLRKRPVEVPA